MDGATEGPGTLVATATKTPGSGPGPTWFERLFGFREGEWSATQARFALEGTTLLSLANGRRFAAGRFTQPCLSELRAACALLPPGRLRCRHEVVGDVLELHGLAENAGAMFQVASQSNCLEFPGSSTVPEDGITGYAFDATQGPACSLAAAAGTVVRNYLVDLRGSRGQRRDRQVDTLAGLSELLGGGLFEVRNGYTFASGEQLDRLASRLRGEERESLLGAVRIGLQSEVGVTFARRWVEMDRDQRVSQAFCTAVSCAYTDHPVDRWEPLATLVLDAAYEATLRAAALERASGRGSGTVWLTLLGDGAFGNRKEWIAAAIQRALSACEELDLDVRVAHFRALDPLVCSHVAQTRD